MPQTQSGELDHFLDLLDREGYRIGVRERMLAAALFAQHAAEGRLPLEQAARLALLQPLLCTNADEQRKFESIIARFAVATPSAKREGVPEEWRGAAKRRLPDWLFAPWLWWVAGGALLVLAIALTTSYLTRQEAKPDQPAAQPKPPAPGTAGTDTEVTDEGLTAPIYVPSAPFPIPKATVAPGVTIARYTLATIGGLSALALAAWALNRLRRRLYLQGLRTDQELDERVLYDPNPRAGAPPLTLVRAVSRLLRQRVAGSGTELDVAATLRASLKTGGGFAPRFRSRRRTPEYIALIERLGSNDQQAHYHHDLVAALQAQDVPIEIYYFERSPALGCWRVGKNGQTLEAKRSDFHALAARWEGERLLVFSDARAAAEHLTGKPAPWLEALHALNAKAWFTPHPLASWGSPEHLLDEQGFLVLPAQPEALDTLAKWLASDRAELALNPAWPALYPPLLRADPLGWAMRQVAPAQEEIEALQFELRNYLGPERFQWLCACALFPSLSWPLTLALGREFFPDGAQQLAYGAAALAALPWFRHGRMPHWLRESLVERLDAEQEARLKATIEERLSKAIEGNSGAQLVTVASRRRLFTWLGRRVGLARDVVLVDFLHKGVARRLAQKLPEPLRRLLFRGGNALYGVRTRWVAAGSATALLAAFTLPGAWEVALGELAKPGLPRIQQVATLENLTEAVAQVRWSQDGALIVAVTKNGRALLYNAAGQLIRTLNADLKTPIERVAFGDSLTIVGGSAANPLVLWNRTGKQYGFSLDPTNEAAQRPLLTPIRTLAVTDQGGRAVATQVGAGALGVLQGATGTFADAEMHPNGQSFAVASSTGAVVWGEVPNARVDLIACAQHQRSLQQQQQEQARSAISTEAVGIANELFAQRKQFGAGILDPVAMTNTVWAAMRQLQTPPNGTILYAADSTAQRDLAQRLLAWLQQKSAKPGWAVKAHSGKLEAVAVSLCQETPGEPKPQDVPLAQRPAAEVFKDCPDCPDMVVVPAGSFLMGSPETEQGRSNDEGPQHKVSIPRALGVGQTEVTRAQFARFVADTGHKTEGGCFTWDATKKEWNSRADASWNSPGFAQSEDHPVVCVNWDDAKAYAQWLAKKAGKNYRLLSEAEWEYAARAGQTTARYWGEAFDPEGCKYANIADATAKRVLAFKDWAYAQCDDKQAYTAPVRSYTPNKFGLYDMIGNAWEWTEDCWNDSYSGAPEDGDVWSKGDCGQRVLRGGSWVNFPDDARAALRSWNSSGIRNDSVGFRLARTD